MGSPDNAEYAGPWMLLYWPLDSWDRQHIRVMASAQDVTVIDLTGGEAAADWVVQQFEFHDDGCSLALSLCRSTDAGTEVVTGTFDMDRGIWNESGSGTPSTSEEWHRKYAGRGAPGVWPFGLRRTVPGA